MDLHLTAIATIICFILYMWTGMKAVKARMKLDITLLTKDKPEDYLRIERAHINTLEQLVIFLPTLWLFAIYTKDGYAALLATIWVIGRVMYVLGYEKEASKRETGFKIAMLPTAIAMFIILIQAIGAAF